MLQEIKTQDQQFTELATNLKCWSFGMVSALFFFFFLQQWKLAAGIF